MRYGKRQEKPRGWVQYDPLDPGDMPPIPAVYVVYIDGRPVYVGQSVDLRNRFHLHNIRHAYKPVIRTPWEDVPNDRPVYVKAHFGWRYGDWAMREFRLIARLQPMYNRHHKGRRAAA